MHTHHRSRARSFNSYFDDKLQKKEIDERRQLVQTCTSCCYDFFNAVVLGGLVAAFLFSNLTDVLGC